MVDKVRAQQRGEADRKQNAPIDPAMVEVTDLLDPVDQQDEELVAADNQTGRRGVALASKEEEKRTLVERVESVFRMVSLAAITCSVVLAVYQYYQGRIDEQKERSVELMNTWQGSEQREAYARLSEALESRLDATGPILAQVTPKALSRIKYNIGRALIEEWSDENSGYQGWSDDVDSIFKFYSEVEFCIRANLCDVPLLAAYFSDDAESFWEYFRYFAEVRRDSFYPNYGAALENLVASLQEN